MTVSVAVADEDVEANPAVCAELLYSPSMQWLLLPPQACIAVRRQSVCPKCKRKLQTLERNAEDSGKQQQQGCVFAKLLVKHR